MRIRHAGVYANSNSSLCLIATAMRSTDRKVLAAFILGVICQTIFLKWTNTNHHQSKDRECVDWANTPAETMTGRQIVDYLKWTNQSACALKNYFGGIFGDLMLLMGWGKDGQKAICMDYQINPDSRGCIVYSFGISSDWSFDEEMQKYGCHIFAFDPSLNVSDHKHSEHIWFYQMGLADRDYEKTVLKNGIESKWKMKSLSSIHSMIVQGRATVIDYLKIDIEGDEWGVIENIIASGMLPNIRQMGIEVHFVPSDGTLSHFRNLAKTLQSLEANGMVRFDSVLNPMSKGFIDAFGFIDFTCYEIAWYNNHLYQTAVKTHDKPF